MILLTISVVKSSPCLLHTLKVIPSQLQTFVTISLEGLDYKCLVQCKMYYASPCSYPDIFAIIDDVAVFFCTLIKLVVHFFPDTDDCWSMALLLPLLLLLPPICCLHHSSLWFMVVSSVNYGSRVMCACKKQN